MKIIISHDVDHLFRRDHWFRDLIYPKLWVRSALELLKGDIACKEAWLRCTSCFQKTRHCIDSLMDFDRRHNVPSTFFFGMNQGLGMSYFPEEAKDTIANVHGQGFDVGVHGIVFDDKDGIRKEYETFERLMGFAPNGIRMHYVRFNESTFDHVAKAGYFFDSTEFDKPRNGTIRHPYKVGEMWEFPLAIMDGYLPQRFDAAKEATLKRLAECKAAGLEYVCILFHDYQFYDGYSDIRDWYVWLIQMIADSEEDSFISYMDAIKELEEKGCRK